MLLCAKLCLPQFHVLKSQTSVPQNVCILGEVVSKEAVKSNEPIRVGP